MVFIKSSIRYSINGGEYISYSDATPKKQNNSFSGRLLSLKNYNMVVIQNNQVYLDWHS